MRTSRARNIETSVMTFIGNKKRSKLLTVSRPRLLGYLQLLVGGFEHLRVEDETIAVVVVEKLVEIGAEDDFVYFLFIVNLHF